MGLEQNFSMETTITLQNLSIGYRSKQQLRVVASHLNASLQRGKLTCLLGANGIGKSTLIRTLAGFLPSLDGDILIQGKPLSSYFPRQLAKEIGVVLTTKSDTPKLSVREIIGIGRSPYTGFWGRLTANDEEIVSDAIHQVGIESLAERPLMELSDGERQKVMIAKSLAQQTPIIILDEPTAFLDFPSKIEILQTLRHLAHDNQVSILLSTHDVELALQLSDCIWLMERDDIHDQSRLSVGTAQELASDGSLSRFIDREGIRFDKESLRIEINH